VQCQCGAEEEAFLRSLGITVRGNVSRKTSLLVAIDPNTLSGKAMKARELGVPIMDAKTFWGIIGHFD
jgi:DNA polymerase-3 subunit epsilon